MKFSFLSSLFLWRLGAVSGQEEQPIYGVDVSWPMHHSSVRTDVQPFGNIQSRYEQYMQSCFDYEESKKPGRGSACYATENNRIETVSRQPKSMRNYTSNGFKKIRAPEHVFKPLKEFWDKNKDNRKLEHWGAGDLYANHWQSPTYMVSVNKEEYDGGGEKLKEEVWNAARVIIQEWTGQRLEEVSLYGVRIYTEGSVLIPHVDRNPLVLSAIINVDQDLDELWPLEVIGHDGLAHNVTMVPGDMVLYESHSIIHGRQFPLKGRFMANVFVHFEPIGPVDGNSEEGGKSNSSLKPYILPDAEVLIDFFRQEDGDFDEEEADGDEEEEEEEDVDRDFDGENSGGDEDEDPRGGEDFEDDDFSSPDEDFKETEKEDEDEDDELAARNEEL